MTGGFVMVVGASGAGKDTLIGIARQHLADRKDIVFPRREITRKPESEDSIEITPETFEARLAAGQYAFAWRAHGLGYGIPAAVAEDVAAGRSVVFNGSRAVAADMLDKHERFLVVHVTVPHALLVERLAHRGREGPGDIERRVARADFNFGDHPNVVHLNNNATPEEGGKRLAEFIAAFHDGDDRAEAG